MADRNEKVNDVEEKFLNKASGAVQITSDRLSFLQRKCYNWLLYNSASNLANNDQFEIRLSVLNGALRNNDTKNLIECVKELVSLRVEFNYLASHDKLKKGWDWEAMTLLSWVAVKNGVLYYKYADELREKLANRQFFAKISLSIQQHFRTKYALALYELCCDHWLWNKQKDFMPMISVTDLRKLLGCAEGETYQEYRYFKNRILKTAMAEINSFAQFSIKIGEEKREKRKVVAIKFCLEPKDNNESVQDMARMDQEPLPLVPGGELYNTLIEQYGVSSSEARKIINEYPVEHIKACLIIAAKKLATGLDPENLGAYTVGTIRKKSMSPPTALLPNEKEESESVWPTIHPGMVIDIGGGKSYVLDEDKVLRTKKGVAMATENQVRISLANGEYRIVEKAVDPEYVPPER